MSRSHTVDHRRFDRPPFTLALVLTSAAALTSACGGEDEPAGASGDAGAGGGGIVAPPAPPTSPGTPVEPERPVTETEQALRAVVAEKRALDAEAFAAAYPAPAPASLTYVAREAAGLDLVQQGAFALSEAEQTALDAHGFVISGEKAFPTFLYGYESIYALDLPVYVSADAVLHAVHSSYDTVLKFLELTTLRARVGQVVSNLRAALAAGGAADYGDDARADLDLYLAVFDSLLRLDGQVSAPVAGADAAMIDYLVRQALAAEGAATVVLFGDDRDLDFSQFTPRGHYTEDPRLKAYFRALIWAGRTEFRFMEVNGETGELEFRRRDLMAAYALRELMDVATTAAWTQVDETVRAFVGEADNLTLPELGRLLTDLDLERGAQLADVDDARIAQAILDNGYGVQQIASQLVINGTEGELPLNRSFLLWGQRYVIDSHAFSNVTWARTEAKRMMPDPLDVAFSVLGNNTAGALLAPEMEKYDYQGDLAAMRALADAHGADFWQANLYTLWLGALRTLSPAAEAPEGVPAVFTGEAFSRRLMNTQLASWAELRHDTLLYAKQSYTDGAACEFPDAYVEPVPEVWQAIADFGTRGRALVSTLTFENALEPLPEALAGEPQLYPSPNLRDLTLTWFDELANTAGILKSMAEHQRAGTPFDDAQMAFINEAIHLDPGCGAPTGATGWLARLYFDDAAAVVADMLVADVHTQPTDEVGTPVGRVLHVGTGYPRLAVFTVETCEGPRAYVGVTSAFHQVVTEDYERLTDEAWQARFSDPATQPVFVPWMADLAPGGPGAVVPSQAVSEF
jgi:hypothetical protein